MNQEETKENSNSSDAPEENLNPAEIAGTSVLQENSQNIDNLPIESIGSYARLEELLTDEDSEKTSNPTAQS